MKIIDKISQKNKDMYGAPSATIAFLGDSVTHGCFECYMLDKDHLETVYDNKNAYSTRIKEIFSMLYPCAQVNIIDSGISGDGTENGVTRIDRDILKFNPDLVVVSFGLNDACVLGEARIDEYRNNLDKIFKKLKSANCEVIFLTENMMATKTSWSLKDELFIKLSKDFAEVENNGVLEKFFNVAKEVAKENDVKVCDVYSKWKKMAKGGVDTTELLANKLNHPIRPLHYLYAISLIETMFE